MAHRVADGRGGRCVRDLERGQGVLDGERPRAGTTSVDASSHLDAKRAAMRAHATQITVAGDVFALSNKIEHRLTGSSGTGWCTGSWAS
jgi:LmbE family N-acetylglucosaminyl deacetylase